MALFTACDDMKPKWEYLVDNPLDTDLAISIDNKAYTIPAKTTQPIGLTQGKHTLTYNGSSVHFVTKINSNKSVTIMNPTLSNYMLHSHFYVRESAKDKSLEDIYNENSVEYQVNGGFVRLPVRVLNTLFIEKTHTPWMFGLDEEIKEEMSLSYSAKQNALEKIYREADYRTKFAETLPEGIIFPVNRLKLSEQPAYVFPIESLTSDCDAANAYMKELEEKWNKIISNPDNIFQDVGKLYYEAGLQQTPGSELNKQCSSQFNPGRDDKAFKAALKRMSNVLKYLSDGSTFIVK